MSFSARFEIKARRKLDARVLVKRIGDAVADHLGDSLIEGVRPDTGAARERKADGKPRGYDTGLLARGIHATAPTGGLANARCTVVVPVSRRMLAESSGGESFISKHGIFTTEGKAGAVIDAAVSAYIAEVSQP